MCYNNNCAITKECHSKERISVEYKYETHMHTSEGSACGRSTGAEQAQAYYDAGYTGIIVTDHFFNGNCAVARELPWEEKVERFFIGYENAYNKGQEIGLDVFLGWEVNFQATEFLVYGLDKEWLLNNEDILSWDVKEHYERVKADGGMIIHAHPFREAPYIKEIRLFPSYVDGVEVYNFGNESVNPKFNIDAYEYAKENELPMTGGTDSHNVKATWGGMIFDHKLDTINDYMNAIYNFEGKVITKENY